MFVLLPIEILATSPRITVPYQMPLFAPIVTSPLMTTFAAINAVASIFGSLFLYGKIIGMV